LGDQKIQLKSNYVSEVSTRKNVVAEDLLFQLVERTEGVVDDFSVLWRSRWDVNFAGKIGDKRGKTEELAGHIGAGEGSTR